jgi:hypothetical protein
MRFSTFFLSSPRNILSPALTPAWPVARDQLTKQLRSTFASNDATATSTCRARLESVFATLGERVRARRGRFLAGDAIGAEDIALAVAHLPHNHMACPAPRNLDGEGWGHPFGCNELEQAFWTNCRAWPKSRS